MANEIALTIDPSVLSKLGVDFKVSKQDLVDIIVAQLEEQLETMEADHKIRKKAAQKRCVHGNQLDTDQWNVIKAKIEANTEAKAFTKEYKKLMKKFIDLGLTTELPENQCNVIEPFNIKFENVQHSKRGWNCQGLNASVYFRQHPIAGLQKIPVLTPEEVEANMLELEALYQEEQSLQVARKNLEKKAKTAKLAIVKAALMNSEEGAKLLEVLDKKAAVLKLTPVNEEK